MVVLFCCCVQWLSQGFPIFQRGWGRFLSEIFNEICFARSAKIFVSGVSSVFAQEGRREVVRPK